MTETKLPTEEDLAGLPYLATVAFAARCARRVQPVYQAVASNSHESKSVIESVDAALSMIENDAVHPSEQAKGDIPAMLDLYEEVETCFAGNLPALSAVNAVVNASGTISYTSTKEAHEDKGFKRSAFLAAKQSLAAANSELTLRAIASDFLLLREAAIVDAWTDETPVPPWFFGPLWPEGAPEDWPADEKPIPPGFQLAIDPGDADAETIQEVLSALSDLHELHTGYALTYRVDGALIFAHSEVLA